MDYRITVQMLEIYNETLRDLLSDGRAAGAANRLDILSTQASGCNVPGAVQVGAAPRRVGWRRAGLPFGRGSISRRSSRRCRGWERCV